MTFSSIIKGYKVFFSLFERNPAHNSFSKLLCFVMNYKSKAEHDKDDGLGNGQFILPFFEISFTLVDIDLFKLYIVKDAP